MRCGLLLPMISTSVSLSSGFLYSAELVDVMFEVKTFAVQGTFRSPHGGRGGFDAAFAWSLVMCLSCWKHIIVIGSLERI